MLTNLINEHCEKKTLFRFYFLSPYQPSSCTVYPNQILIISQMLKGQSYYLEQRLKIFLLPSIVTSLSLMSTFPSELRQKLTCDPVIINSDPVQRTTQIVWGVMMTSRNLETFPFMNVRSPNSFVLHSLLLECNVDISIILKLVSFTTRELSNL